MEHKDAVILCRIFENLEDASVETHCYLEEMLMDAFPEFEWIFDPVSGNWEVF